MARHVLLHVDTPEGRQSGPVAEDIDWLRTVIAYRLRNGGVENPTATYAFGADTGTRRISGAIFLSLTPRQVRSLLVDARISILLARQRCLDKRRAFRPTAMCSRCAMPHSYSSPYTVWMIACIQDCVTDAAAGSL